MIDERRALEELARRQMRREQAGVLREALKKELFAQQIQVWDSSTSHNAVICPRRAGKTQLWSRLVTGEAVANDKALIRIWHLSRLRCKQLMWEPMLEVFRRHAVKVKANETELTVKFPNGSEIRLVGADKDKELQKKRGDKVWCDIVLETQLFGPLLKPLVDDVIEPCLADEQQRGGGKLFLEGSPGPVCAGLFYEITGRHEELRGTWESIGDVDGVGAGWRCFRWQSTDNPFMPHMAQWLAALKKKRRWDEANPTYRREYMGLWVNDHNALFYKYDEKRNGFTHEQVQPWGPGWQHVLGWDLGSKDDMALVVWGYHTNMPDLYEAFSWKKPGALSAEIMEQIDRLESMGFDFVGMVADTQGGGKMYVEDVMSRFSKNFEAAKKGDKAGHVVLYNDDLLTGHIKVRRGSPLELELKTLPIDPDWDPLTEKPPNEAPNFPNHCCDAALYSWRKARHYWHTPKVDDGLPKVSVTKEEEAILAGLRRSKEEHWLEREFADDQDFLGDEW